MTRHFFRAYCRAESSTAWINLHLVGWFCTIIEHVNLALHKCVLNCLKHGMPLGPHTHAQHVALYTSARTAPVMTCRYSYGLSQCRASHPQMSWINFQKFCRAGATGGARQPLARTAQPLHPIEPLGFRDNHPGPALCTTQGQRGLPHRTRVTGNRTRDRAEIWDDAG